ncbi:MAG: hypothetical protein WC748_02280 [Legionellales bacterium]|jgi:hypothetical protein
MITYLKRALLCLVCSSASYATMANDTAIIVCDAEEKLRVVAFSVSIIPFPEEKNLLCASLLKSLKAEGFTSDGNPVTSDGLIIYTLGR